MREIRNCNVAVVGGAGFLGSHLVDHLIEDRNCEVLVIDNLVAGRREFIHPKARFIHHDITGSEEYLQRIFKENNIRFVQNFAAYPYVPDSFVRPIHVSNVNFMGALHVINAAQEAGCEGVLQISSAEIYGNAVSGDSPFPFQNKIDENAPIEPHSSYGASKAAVDAAVQIRWREAKTPCIALRQFNCCGIRETHDYVIPTIISQLKDDPNAEIKLGNNSFRDFLYAGDQAKMATELLEKGNWGEVYNLGSEQGIKIYDLAQKIASLMGSSRVNPIVVDPVRVRPYEIWHLLSDNSKIYSTIESRPQVHLDEALKKTIAYFRENGGKWCWN